MFVPVILLGLFFAFAMVVAGKLEKMERQIDSLSTAVDALQHD
jgi:hypothetical protein